MSKKTGLKDRIIGAFKRGHPDVYEAISEYADKQGISVADAIAAASSAYVMASGEEGKARLEELMGERRAEKLKGGGTTDISNALGQVTELLKGLSSVFGAMNEVRSSVSIKSTVEEYKSIASAAKEIQSAGAAGGAGSVDDVIAQAFVEALIGGAIKKKLVSAGTKTGVSAGKEIKAEEQP